jgi:hypothetical protein
MFIYILIILTVFNINFSVYYVPILLLCKYCLHFVASYFYTLHSMLTVCIKYHHVIYSTVEFVFLDDNHFIERNT